MIEPLPEPSERSGVNWGQLVVVVLLCVVSVLIGVTLPYARNASSGTEALAVASDVDACSRDAGSDITDARTALDRAKADDDILDNQFRDALSYGDVAAIERIRAENAPARERIIAASAEVDRVNTAYQAAVDLLRFDRDEFLARCQAGTLMPAPLDDTPDPATTVTTAPTTTAVPFTTTAPMRRRASTTTTTGTTVPATTSTTRARPTSTTQPPCEAFLTPLSIPLELPC